MESGNAGMTYLDVTEFRRENDQEQDEVETDSGQGVGHPSRGNKDIQLDLFRDYASNVALYPAFHDYFRKAKPPLLAIWGKNDPFFLPAGAEAFRKDIPNAQVEFLDTGHFALETHAVEIATRMKELLAANGGSQ